MTELPQPTDSENETLALHIVDWRDRSPIEQAVCLAILRGHHYQPQIAEYLQVDVAMVKEEVPKLIGQGLLWDNHKLLLH